MFVAQNVQPALDSLAEVHADSTAKAEGKKFKNAFFFFITTKKEFKEEFQNDDTKFFQSNILTYNDSLNNIALYSEVASDFIGPVRVGVGLTLAYPKTDTNTVQQQKINKEKFLQRLGTAGGSLVFNFALPIVNKPGKIFSTGMALTPRFSLDPPAFGISSKSFIHNTSIGLDFQADLMGVKDIIHFFGNARIAYVDGNATFYDAMSLTGKDRKGFMMNNYTIGVQVKDVFRLSYSGFGGSKLVKDRFTGFISLTVEPNFK